MGVCVPDLQCVPSTTTPTEPKLATRKRELASSHAIEHARLETWSGLGLGVGLGLGLGLGSGLGLEERLETLAEPRSCIVLPSGPGEHGARPTRTSCPAP